MNKQKIINNKKSSANAELFIIMHHMFFKIMLHQPHSNIKTNINCCENILIFIRLCYRNRIIADKL